MGYIDYEREPKSDIAFIDMKSFYASVECVERNLHPLNTSLCVMSRADGPNGLILASSPQFKKVFGKNNVGRARDLPFSIETRKFDYEAAARQNLPITREYVHYIENWAERTFIVPPRMAFYIEKNLKIQKIFTHYAPEVDIHPYSIDEGFIDLTSTLSYFIPNPNMSRRDKLDLISARIQDEIWRETGIYSTVGMSNANPLLAKLALDNEAKRAPTMRANWSYEDVESKVWSLKNMTDFWGIGPRMEKRLNKLNIYSIRDLALTNPDELKRELGIMGLQLWFHANGVDESKPSHPYIPKEKGLGNSQILPRDYRKQKEIELVLREMAEQVAIRIRRIQKKATVVALYIGFSYEERRNSIHAQRTIAPSQSTEVLMSHILALFREKYQGGAVRRIGVRYGNLIDDHYTIYSFFEDTEKMRQREELDKTIDAIREKHGFLAVQRANYLMEGSRAEERSKLVGGHCGGMDGIQ